MSKTLLIVLIVSLVGTPLFADGPEGKDFGFGITLGDPLGGTIKYWMNEEGALNLMVGNSQYGKPRISLDYQHLLYDLGLDLFYLYAGPGIALGIGDAENDTGEDRQFYELEESEMGLAARAIIGIVMIPEESPFELFVEMGPLVGLVPEVGAAFDFGVGFRFYP